jgi:transcriptional regulator with XRE-family HTH domain
MMKTDDEQRLLDHFGNNLRSQRVIRRLSQEQLGFTADVHRTQFRLIENGHRAVLLPTFVRLCGALQMSPDELLKGISWEPASTGREGSFLIVGDSDFK